MNHRINKETSLWMDPICYWLKVKKKKDDSGIVAHFVVFDVKSSAVL